MISKMCFSLYNCFSYEDGNSYLKKDMTIKCWEGNHTKMSFIIGLLFIIVWTISFPIYIYIALRNHRKQFEQREVLLKFGFFYVGLNDEAFYWEIVVANTRKVLFIIFSTLLSSNDSQYKVTSILSLFI